MRLLFLLDTPFNQEQDVAERNILNLDEPRRIATLFGATQRVIWNKTHAESVVKGNLNQGATTLHRASSHKP